MLEEEERTGIKYPHLNRDLQALSTLQKLIIKQKTWEKYNGDPDKERRLAGLEQDLGQRFSSEMEQFDEEGRVKIVKALGRFMELAQEKSVPIDKYLLVEPKK